METTYINPIINEIEVKSANNRRIYLTGYIDEEMAIKVSYFTNKILEIDKLRPPEKKEITFIINSNGGSVIYGNSILTNIQLMKNNGYKIIGKVESMAYSMAFDILVNCDYRIGGKYSTYLLHQTAFGIGGELKEIENEVEFQKKIWEMSIDYYVKNTNLTREQVEEIYGSKINKYFTSYEALNNGILNEII